MFENVNVVKKANVYFDGKVTSRTVFFPNGEKKTLGLMQEGEYTFGTGAAEVMEILAGECEVVFDGKTLSVKAGESFEIPANSSFDISCKSIVDYCCSYIN